jgi:hypothetical protein
VSEVSNVLLPISSEKGEKPDRVSTTPSNVANVRPLSSGTNPGGLSREYGDRDRRKDKLNGRIFEEEEGTEEKLTFRYDLDSRDSDLSIRSHKIDNEIVGGLGWSENGGTRGPCG